MGVSRPLSHAVCLCLSLLGAPSTLPAFAADAARDSAAVGGAATSPERAPAASDSTSAEPGPAALERARELIKTGDYDTAIELLRSDIEQARRRDASLRDAYLLLIKTHVILSNDYKFKPQMRAASDLSYQEAKRVITECLRTKTLRHTQPEPASEYPREMITAFAEVRGQIFGSFRVAELEPPDAVVLLDSDTLRSLPSGGKGDVDLEVGPHVVLVQAPGYKDLTENVTISPNSTLERAYHLTKRRSGTWYATVATGAAGLVAGVVALIGGSAGGTSPAEPLPPAPDPPGGQ